MNAPPPDLGDIDWKETSALMAVLAVLLIPLRYVARSIKRRWLVPMFTEALEAALAPRFKTLDETTAGVSRCATELGAVVDRLEYVDDDITVLFDVGLGIDRRSWGERRQQLREQREDRRRAFRSGEHRVEDP